MRAGLRQWRIGPLKLEVNFYGLRNRPGITRTRPWRFGFCYRTDPALNKGWSFGTPLGWVWVSHPSSRRARPYTPPCG